MEANKPADLTLECLVHDLNNVFQTLLEAADLLATDPQWSSLAGAICHSVERGRNIVSSIGPSHRTPVEIGAALENATQFVEDFLRVHSARVEITREVERGLRVPGAESAWERVFVNLLLNAAQAMPDGGIVEVDAHRKAGRVRIMVSDNGPGVSPEILSEIFKPRFSTKTWRSGLGLHIVETIVSQNGGVVSAANRPDRSGAVFTIEIPEEMPAAISVHA